MADKPVNRVNIGGVTLDWNQVKSKKVQTVNGQKVFIIEFKTGVKAIYPTQNSNDGASIDSRELTMWQSLDYDNETFVKNLDNAVITGSIEDDHIIAENVYNTTIDVSDDNNDDQVDVVSAHYKEVRSDGTLRYVGKDNHGYSHDNKVKLDKHDKASEIVKNYENSEKTDEYTLSKVKGPGTENRF